MCAQNYRIFHYLNNANTISKAFRWEVIVAFYITGNGDVSLIYVTPLRGLQMLVFPLRALFTRGSDNKHEPLPRKDKLSTDVKYTSYETYIGQ